MTSSGWLADPSGRHQKRYFDGVAWTDRVLDGARQGIDPFGSTAPESPAAPRYALAPTPQYVVVAPQGGNGFAVAGFTLGIVGAVIASLSPFGYFLGGICGLLGLIFGLLGLGNVRRGAPSGGLAIAGVVLGAVAVALAIYSVVNYYRLAHAIRHSFASSTPGVVVNASPSLNNVHVASCYRVEGVGMPAATGTLVNTSSRNESFRVTIAFHAHQLAAEGVATTSVLAPGETGYWSVRGIGSLFRPDSCTVVASPGAT